VPTAALSHRCAPPRLLRPRRSAPPTAGPRLMRCPTAHFGPERPYYATTPALLAHFPLPASVRARAVVPLSFIFSLYYLYITPSIYLLHLAKISFPKVSFVLVWDHGFGFLYMLRIWRSLVALCLHLLLLGCSLAATSWLLLALNANWRHFTAPWSLHRRLVRWRLMDGESKRRHQ